MGIGTWMGGVKVLAWCIGHPNNETYAIYVVYDTAIVYWVSEMVANVLNYESVEHTDLVINETVSRQIRAGGSVTRGPMVFTLQESSALALKEGRFTQDAKVDICSRMGVNLNSNLTTWHPYSGWGSISTQT